MVKVRMLGTSTKEQLPAEHTKKVLPQFSCSTEQPEQEIQVEVLGMKGNRRKKNAYALFTKKYIQIQRKS